MKYTAKLAEIEGEVALLVDGKHFDTVKATSVTDPIVVKLLDGLNSKKEGDA